MLRHLQARTTAPIALTLALCGCVNVDPNTDEVIPRGGQRYEFEDVKRNVDRLRLGMTRLEVLTVLGSPAEKSQRSDVWVYLPERPAVIVPGKALRLEFTNGRLSEFGYHPIVLGARL
jgi:outer membrane protein assembly factor BamE (lipoprotein component of BamABCDE complex)